MKPGERVTLITKIASALSAKDYAETDTILEQFGFPVSHNWNGTEYAYVVAHVKDGSDEQLVVLHDHLFPADASNPGSSDRVREASEAWAPGFRLFLATQAHKKRRSQISKPSFAVMASPDLSRMTTSSRPRSGKT